MDQQLRVFVVVAEKRNFSRAAEELHMTQPGVSLHIQTLERTMQTRLFERSNKSVQLTRAGDIVYHHAKEILGLYERMDHLIQDLMNTASGDLNIGASYTFGEYVLPHIISRFRSLYPKINPNITIANTSHIAELTANRQIDVGIVEGAVSDMKLNIEPYTEDTMVLIVPKNHPLAAHQEISPADLVNENWIVRETGSGTREATDRMFQQVGVIPKSLMEFGSTQVIKESVEAGFGIALVSNWTIRKELLLHSIHSLTIKGFPTKRRFSIVTQKTIFQTKAIELFLGFLHSQNSKISQSPQTE